MIPRTLMSYLFLAVLATQTAAQNSTQWDLPEGARARLGKSGITGDLVYSSDGKWCLFLPVAGCKLSVRDRSE